MAENEPIYRPEFDAFRSEMRGDMREVRDEMVRGHTRQDTTERQLNGLQTEMRQGFDGLRDDIKSLRSTRSWVIGGLAAGGSAVGSAIWHAISTGIHP